MTPLGESEGYWYPPRRNEQPSAVDVLNALREYRASETAMRRRTRTSMAMGETDLLALRYLLEAETAGQEVRPKELAARLGMTSASMTALVDRIASSGYITREPHPSDRRAIILRPTRGADEEVRHTLGNMHGRMIEIAESLTPVETRAVLDFLVRMREAVDAIDIAGD